MMSEIRKMLRQSSHYLGGMVAAMAAGFLSFPILTRIFSVDDYGILGLVSTTIFVCLVFAKLGFQTSIVRFYSERKAGSGLSEFYSTMLIGTLGAAGITSILLLVVTRLLPSELLDTKLSNLLVIVSAIVFFTGTTTILMAFLRAEQRTRLYNVISVTRAYSQLFLSVFFVFYIFKGLRGFFIGRLVVGIVVFSILFVSVLKRQRIAFRSFSGSFFIGSVRFGFPLVLAELGHLLLNYADRYLILFYLDAAALGLYTAGYNLSMHVADVIKYPVNYALTPIYMDILANKGEEETRRFLSKVFTIFCLVTLPVTFGFIAVREDLIVFLASSKYAMACSVIPYVMVGQAIYSCQIILNCGLFIHKKTYIMTLTMLLSVILNLILNILWIPKNGILGAAQATLVSYIVYTVVITFFAFKLFRFEIEWQKISVYLGASLTMFLAINFISFESHLLNLLAGIALGILVYTALVLCFDRESRTFVRGMILDSIIAKATDASDGKD